MTDREDGVERLRRWTDEQRGVPPAFGRMRACVDHVVPGSTTIRLPLEPELLLPDGAPSGAVTAMLTDFGLASAVISSLPDLRGVTTVSLSVDHLSLPPATGALVATCMAAPYVDGGLQHATGTIADDAGSPVALVSGWLIPTPAEPEGMAREGVPVEPMAAHLGDLLGTGVAADLRLVARDALSNAIGSLHGGSLALACELAAEAALPGMRPLATSLAFLRPTPREGGVAVHAAVVREGRRTGLVDVTVTDDDGRTLVTGRLVLGAGGATRTPPAASGQA